MANAEAQPTSTAACADSILSITDWCEGAEPTVLSSDEEIDRGEDGVRWIDLPSSADAERLLPRLSKLCPGLTEAMLTDLLTPDDKPEGEPYGDGAIRLASTFAVEARRLEHKQERGTAMRSGVLVFQPVELLAGDRWLLTCWHPKRTFAGAEKVCEDPPGFCEEIRTTIEPEWKDLRAAGGGDLGLLVMKRLAIGYRSAGWTLSDWHQDWELSLYVDDSLDNPEELPNLWE